MDGSQIVQHPYLFNTTSINDDMDSSLLDVSADIIGETPKKKPTSSRSFSKNVVKCPAIVTPRVDAAESLSSTTLEKSSRMDGSQIVQHP